MRSFNQTTPTFNTAFGSPFNRTFPTGSMGGFPVNRSLTPGFGGLQARELMACSRGSSGFRHGH